MAETRTIDGAHLRHCPVCQIEIISADDPRYLEDPAWIEFCDKLGLSKLTCAFCVTERVRELAGNLGPPAEAPHA